MKINSRFSYSLIFLLIAIGLPAESAFAQQTNVLKSQYQKFKQDITLIKNCYLKRSAICTDTDRLAARGALLRASAEGLALVVLVAVALRAGYLAYSGTRKPLYFFLKEDLDLTEDKVLLPTIGLSEVKLVMQKDKEIDNPQEILKKIHQQYPNIIRLRIISGKMDDRYRITEKGTVGKVIIFGE